MALTGHLSDLSLSELIEFFCNQRKTGQLKVLYPQGSGHFYLQTGSVVDARIGVLRGIDAVYYALTLPNAKFEFGGDSEPTERTINQPWTQVVLEGLRRLDEGVVPPAAFPPNYRDQNETPDAESPGESFNELENLRVPSFLSLMSSDTAGKRKFVIAGAVAFVVMASVAAIGIPAGWYNRAKVSVASQPVPVVTQAAAPAEVPTTIPAENSPASVPSDDAALAAKRQREKDKEKAKAREEKAALTQTAPGSVPAPSNVASEASKPGSKKITVTVTYDESGRVTQASGGDASAIRIARQKRFPAGKAGSATITIPIN
jgi:hypothetical protein